MDFCKYIQTIAKNPKAIAPPITVGEFMQLEVHVNICDDCYELLNQVLEENEDEPESLFGMN